MEFMREQRLAKETEAVINGMKALKKYFKFSRHNDFVILNDDFTVEELEAIIFKMKGKQNGTNGRPQNDS